MLNQQKLSAIDETLAFLAHELNTPLAAIVNFGRGIGRRVVGDDPAIPQRQEIGNAAAAIHDNARYCLSVLSSFVDSVRSASLASASRSGTTASQLLASLLDTYPLNADQRALIQVDIREDFRITALPNCVALVLSSILSNALRALDGSPAPTLCVTVSMNEGPQIHISDNGPGIPAEIREHLLVDPVTTHADSGGSGRGMIFCNRIMQAIGGSLLIHSEPAERTTITLNFPAIQHPSNRSDR
jgi:two-component system response regulator PhcR